MTLRRLSGQDSMFLSADHPNQLSYSHSLFTLATTDRNGAPIPPLTVEQVSEQIGPKLDQIAFLRWRVLPVPGGIGHPVAIEDPDFDISRHIRTLTLDPPGSMVEIDKVISQLCCTEMPTDRPMWEIILIQAPDGGSTKAMAFRFHHSLADGAPMLLAIERLFGDVVASTAIPRWKPDPIPTRSALLRAALAEKPRQLASLPSLIMEGVRRLRHWNRLTEASPVPGPAQLGISPWSVLSTGAEASRSNVNFVVPFEDLELIKDAARVRFVSVIIAATAGGIRRYLEASGQLPKEPLLAGMLVSNDRSDPPREFGNRIFGLRTTLATDISDDWERLIEINAVADSLIRRFRDVDPEVIFPLFDVIPPALVRGLIASRVKGHVKHPDRPDTTINVSVLKGFTDPLHVGPAEVTGMWLIGPPSSGSRLTATAVRFGDDLCMNLHGFYESLPDPLRLQAAFSETVESLKAAALARRGAGSSGAQGSESSHSSES